MVMQSDILRGKKYVASVRHFNCYDAGDASVLWTE